MSKSLLMYLGLLVCLVACQTDSALPQARQVLVSIPVPDFESMEAQVRSQLKTAQDTLDAILGRGDTENGILSRMFGEMGQQYQAYEFEEAAQACYVNARTLDPKVFQWAYFLGHLLKKGKQPEESIKQFEQALILNPDYFSGYIALAEGYIGSNRLDEAESILNRARVKDEASASVFFGLGRVASIRNAHEEAITYFENARRLAPEAGRVNYPLGMAYRAQGNHEKARFFLAQKGGAGVTLKDPLLDDLRMLTKGGHALKIRGNRAYIEGRFEEAQEAYEQALAAAPDNPESHVNLAVVLTALNQNEKAMHHLEEALLLDPIRQMALFNLGSLLAKQGRDLDALPYYRRALDSDPDFVNAHFNLANAQLRLGQLEEAVIHYEKVIELTPSNAAARHRQALALVGLQRWEAARLALEAGYEALPSEGLIINLLARLLAACPVEEIRDGLRSLNLAQTLVEGNRSLGNIEVLAMALAEQGRFDEAAELQEQSLVFAKKQGRTDLEGSLTANLARYQNKKPSRNPGGF